MRTRMIALVALLLGVGCTSALAASQYAVLVGVGKYHPDSVQSFDLKGPPTDLALMQEVLAHYGFRPQDMHVLADEAATRVEIVKAVSERLLTLAPGSLAVFYYSGHGSAVRGTAGAEANDETIVPYDGRVRGQPARDILDDQIYAWGVALNSRNVGAVFIFDSCVSGGAGRPAGTEVRRIEPYVADASAQSADRARNLRTDASGQGSSPVVILTASKDTENAYGKLDPATGKYQGVFTGALHRLLLPVDASLPPKTWSGVESALIDQLKPTRTGTPLQTPQLFGTKSAPVFGSGQPFSHTIKAKLRSRASAELGAGSVGGITEGSVFKLFGPHQIPWRTSDQFEATAKASRVREQTADLEVLEGALFSDPLFAVEFDYALPQVKLKLAIATAARLDAMDKQALQAALAGVGEIVDGQVDLVVTASSSHLQLATPAGAPVGAPIELADGPAVREALRLRLRDYARWQRLLLWKRGSVRPTGLRVTLEYQAASGSKTLQDGELADARIPAGATMRLRVQNTGTRPVRADALLLRQDFTVDVCPMGIVDRNVRLQTEEASLASGPGAAGWKLIISDSAQTVDYSHLHTEKGARSAQTSLEDELAGVWHGSGASSRRSGGSRDFQWQTVEIPLTALAAGSTSGPQRVKRCLGIPEKAN